MSKSSQIGLGLLVIISALAYYYFGYHIHREQFTLLIVVYSICFGSFIYFLQAQTNILFPIGVLFRVILLFSLPNLSQDFYRFIWDGRLILSGINPYLFTPNELVNLDFQTEFLAKMGQLSSGNYSNYPPLNQFFFYFSALIGKGNIQIEVLVLKIIIILGDIGVYFFGKKVLETLSMPASRIHFYYLNPLVIIELTGNLHFEGLMMCFWSVALYYLFKQKSVSSAIFWAFSILIKLIPLLFIPLLYKYLGLKRFIYFSIVTLSIILLGFLPFYDSAMLLHYYKTVGLWFGKFEFNASIYYLFRKLGLLILGYNINIFYGWILKGFLLYLIYKLSFFRETFTSKQILQICTLFFSLYLMTATTVHPWYLVTLVFLGVYVPAHYIKLWSFSIVLSYGAYQLPEVKESAFLLLIQYVPVYLLFYIFWKGYFGVNIREPINE